MKKLWMSWSSGKDCAFALAELYKNSTYNVTGLFTSINEKYARVAMHSTRVALLQRQAQMLGLPLEIVALPGDCTNEIYESRIKGLIEKAVKAGVSAMGFGDLFLQDIRDYRERQLADSGIEAVFPLWKRPTGILAKEMLSSGIEAVLTCIDPSKLSESFAGRYFDTYTIGDLPQNVDPCGENGEFHTYVFAGPLFKEKIPIVIGKTVKRGNFIYADVLPAD
jgi:uncharacterized protein (TIGR00290 family)